MRYALIVMVLLTLGAQGASAAPPPAGPSQIRGGRVNPTPCPNASCGDIAQVSEAHFEELMDQLADVRGEFFVNYLNAFSGITEDFICRPPGGVWVTPEDGGTACFKPSFEYEGSVWTAERRIHDWTVRVTCQIIKSCAQLTSIEWEHPQVHLTCGEGSECGRWKPGVVLAQRFKTAFQSSGATGELLRREDFVTESFEYKFVYPEKYTEKTLLQPGGANWVSCSAGICPDCIESPPLYLRIERAFSDKVPSLAVGKLHLQIQNDLTSFLGTLGNYEGIRTGWLADTPICTEKATVDYLESVEMCAAGYGRVAHKVDEYRFTYDDIWRSSNVSSPAVPEAACESDGEPLQAEPSYRLFTESGAPSTLFWISFVGRIKSESALSQ